MRLEPCKEGRVTEKPIFHHLGIASTKFAVGKRIKRGEIGKDGSWLVEGTDQVLAGGRIDTGLATDRAVDLRQQCRRHLNEVNTTKQACSGKADQVADDPATKGNKDNTAVFLCAVPTIRTKSMVWRCMVA